MLKFDFSAFEKMADRLKVAEQQIPFAISKAMNASAFATRQELVNDTWPRHVSVHNKNFARASLRVEPASKSDLQVRITDSGTGGRSLMGALADGGSKTAGGGALAVPVAGQRRGARGIVPSQRPRNLKKAFKKGDAIYEIVGRGKKKRLKLAYILKPSVNLPKTVPLHEDFARSMRQEMEVRVPQAMLDAMKTALRR